MEMRPKVKCPDQTDDGIFPLVRWEKQSHVYRQSQNTQNCEFSLEMHIGCTILEAGVPESKAGVNVADWSQTPQDVFADEVLGCLLRWRKVRRYSSEGGCMRML